LNASERGWNGRTIPLFVELSTAPPISVEFLVAIGIPVIDHRIKYNILEARFHKISMFTIATCKCHDCEFLHFPDTYSFQSEGTVEVVGTFLNIGLGYVNIITMSTFSTNTHVQAYCMLPS
jgi:hypothetical protein